MATKNDQNDIKVSPGPIPEGWLMLTELKANGTEVQYYFCPRTEQRFYSYEALIQSNFEANLKQPEGFAAVKREGQSSSSEKNIRKRKKGMA